MSEKYVTKNNTGNMFLENNVTVPRKGKININGEDKYCGILKYSGDGNYPDKYELVVSLGLLHYNKPEDKKSKGTPDIGGKITHEGTVYKFGGWANMSDKGTDYTSVKLTPYDAEGNLIIENKVNITPSQDNSSDDIPF